MVTQKTNKSHAYLESLEEPEFSRAVEEMFDLVVDSGRRRRQPVLGLHERLAHDVLGRLLATLGFPLLFLCRLACLLHLRVQLSNTSREINVCSLLVVTVSSDRRLPDAPPRRARHRTSVRVAQRSRRRPRRRPSRRRHPRPSPQYSHPRARPPTRRPSSPRSPTISINQQTKH